MLFEQVQEILKKNRRKLTRLGVKALAIFGSVAKGKNKPKSDVDVLVDFDSRKGLFGFIGLKHFLEEILGCEVDLVTKNGLHPALKKRILKEARDVL